MSLQGWLGGPFAGVWVSVASYIFLPYIRLCEQVTWIATIIKRTLYKPEPDGAWTRAHKSMDRDQQS